MVGTVMFLLARCVAFAWAAAGSVPMDVGGDESCEDCQTGMMLLQTESAAVRSTNSAKAEPDENWHIHVMEQMEKRWRAGFWAISPSLPSSPECGNSTFKDLQMNIPLLKQKHPEVEDFFCYFENHALWFGSAGKAAEIGYHEYGKSGLRTGDEPLLCGSTGEMSTAGPEVTMKYDGGEFTWPHVRNCIDIIDDPYCYSLGWLKGQGLDGSLMSNATAWKELAKQECADIQEEFKFDDEEVTVGRHVFSTPLYFRRTLNSLKGTGTPISRRLHKEHVYTKCQLGDGAPAEMAYCYYKGCVLPGNRIGHTNECGYDAAVMSDLEGN